MTVDRARGIKKSRFPAQTSIPAGATFDFVINGTNIKITKEDLLAALGVTGTIVQQGAVTGTPVLNTQGSVNNIRNLENGFGVKASLSPENGITLDHNFTIDSTGLPIMLNKATTTPDFISLVAKLGITLTAVNNTIEILNNGALQIVEANANYQVLANDDIINCLGTFNVTLPNILSATKEYKISSTNGTITVLGDAVIEAPTSITTGSTNSYYPARGQWWQG